MFTYVKVGIVEDRIFPERLKEYEREADLGLLVIFDGWVSKALPNVRRWETRARDAIGAVPGVQKAGRHREYFSGISFERALEIVNSERTA
jgi:hypothetical protein